MGKYVTRTRLGVLAPDGLSGNDGNGDPSVSAAVARALAVAILALSVLAACAPGVTTGSKFSREFEQQDCLLPLSLKLVCP